MKRSKTNACPECGLKNYDLTHRDEKVWRKCPNGHLYYPEGYQPTMAEVRELLAPA